jgi:hypothetical protein
MAPQAARINTRCPAAHVYMRERGPFAPHPANQFAHATRLQIFCRITS